MKSIGVMWSHLNWRQRLVAATNFVEEFYRSVIAICLVIFLILQFSLSHVETHLSCLAACYCIYAAVIHLVWKRKDTYSLNTGRYVRFGCDLCFALCLIYFTGGSFSPALVLLAIPLFLAAQRFETRTSIACISLALLGFVITCYFPSDILATPPSNFDIFIHLLCLVPILSILPLGARLIKIFFRERLSNAFVHPNECDAIEEPQQVAELLVTKMSVHACLVFVNTTGSKYQLKAAASRRLPAHGESKSLLADLLQQQVFLSPDAVLNANSNQRGVRLFSTHSIKPFCTDRTGELMTLPDWIGHPRSMFYQKVRYPWAGCPVIVVLLNKLKEIIFPSKTYVRDFSADDTYLLSVILDSLNASVHLRMYQRERDSFSLYLDKGVITEVSRFNSQGELTFINKAKLDFFGHTTYSRTPGPPCWRFFHNRRHPCNIVAVPNTDRLFTLGPDIPHNLPPTCESYKAFNSTEPIKWSLLYEHKGDGRRHVSHIRAQRVVNSRGQTEVMETVHDTTNKHRHEVLTRFMMDMATDKYNSEDLFAQRAIKLFGDLLFRRARLYKYSIENQQFILLAQHGHKDLKDFTVPLTPQPTGGHDSRSPKWIRDRIDSPILLRYDRPGGLPRKDPPPDYCHVIQTTGFDFATVIHSEKSTERLDIPIRFQGGDLLGKVSLDNVCEDEDYVEKHLFNTEDISIAWFAGREIGYALSRLYDSIVYLRTQKLFSLAYLTYQIAHDLNGPINKIKLAAQSIESNISSLPPQTPDMLKLIHEKCAECNQQVNEIFVRARGSAPPKTPQDLGSLVAKTLARVSFDYRGSGINFATESHLAKDAPFLVDGDAYLLMAALTTLFKNSYAAMKHHPPPPFEFSTNHFTEKITPSALLAAIRTGGTSLPNAGSDIESLNLLLRGSILHQIATNKPLPQDGSELMKRASSLSEAECMKLNWLILKSAYPQLCPGNTHMLRVRISRLEQSHVQIEINDTGPGFSQNIIDAFERRDQFLQSTTGGAGFGLMLARNIIENQHEGTLQIGNNENGGARIKIKLPVKSTNERNK